MTAAEPKQSTHGSGDSTATSDVVVLEEYLKGLLEKYDHHKAEQSKLLYRIGGLLVSLALATSLYGVLSTKKIQNVQDEHLLLLHFLFFSLFCVVLHHRLSATVFQTMAEKIDEVLQGQTSCRRHQLGLISYSTISSDCVKAMPMLGLGKLLGRWSIFGATAVSIMSVVYILLVGIDLPKSPFSVLGSSIVQIDFSIFKKFVVANYVFAIAIGSILVLFLIYRLAVWRACLRLKDWSENVTSNIRIDMKKN